MVEPNSENRIIIPDTLNNHLECSLSEISRCSHEEADTRVFLHAKDAAKLGFKTVTISANDTDVLVIAEATFSQLLELGLQELAFGQGRNLKWIPVHELTSTLTLERSNGMLFFNRLKVSQVVIQGLHSTEMTKSQLDRHGMCALRLHMSSSN